MNDKDFFNANPTRQARVRRPSRVPYKTKQRAVRYGDEFEPQFQSMGSHDRKCRAIIVYRLPHDNPNYDPEKPQLIPIPILEAFVGELQDTDEFLLPLIHELMTGGAG